MLKHSQVKSIEKEVNKRIKGYWSKDMYFSIHEAHFNYIDDLKDFVTLVCQAGKDDKTYGFKFELSTVEVKDKNEAAALIYFYLIKRIENTDVFSKK